MDIVKLAMASNPPHWRLRCYCSHHLQVLECLGFVSFVVVVVVTVSWVSWFGLPDECNLHEGGMLGCAGCCSVVVISVSQ